MSSVKFQDDAAVRAFENKAEDVAHNIGERLTGGKTQTGYLQVRGPSSRLDSANEYLTIRPGLPQTTPVESPPHEDAHIGLSFRASRIPCVLDRPRCQQTRTLFQLASTEDGDLRDVHQRSVGPCSRRNPSEDLRRQDQFEGQDSSDSRQ